MPCLCTNFPEMTLALAEVAVYFIAYIFFLIANRKKTQQTSVHAILVLILFSFLLHTTSQVSLFYGYDTRCKQLNDYESFEIHVPQAFFYLVFIWVIFKLLIINNAMFSTQAELGTNGDNRLARFEEARRADKNIRYQVGYTLVWIVIWVGQRLIECQVIGQ